MVHHGAGSDRTADFHAHHAPIGALAGFTLGRFFTRSGPACEKSGAADGGVRIGYRDADGTTHLLPFFPADASERARYTQQGGEVAAGVQHVFGADEIRRDYGWCTDAWSAGDLRLRVRTPLVELPDPRVAGLAAQRDAFLPAITLEIEVHNPRPTPRELVVSIVLPDRWLPLTGINGLHSRFGTGIAIDASDATAFTAFDLDQELTRTHPQPLCALGLHAGFRATVAPRTTRRVTVAIGWWRPEVVTIGRECRYWYTRLFSGIADVLTHALARAEAIAETCDARDAELRAAALDDEQRFLIAHATRGYAASTQLLDDGGTPRWVVNEGEYLMLNTFDLTVDMAFHELRYQPWALRDVLDQFARDYRYESRVYEPRDPHRLLPGGVAFTHDMGVQNAWSPSGRSSYEVDGLDRACFSHMSCEELCNWVLCAGLYWSQMRDGAFLARHAGLIGECQLSLLHRDHPEAGRRRGWMQCEDERCRGGGEITTYDSLDHSLGQARANVYLAGKMWASHLAIAMLARAAGRPAVAQASLDAARVAATAIADAANADGVLPALLDGSNAAAVIPAIEALVYPWRMGLREACSDDGPYARMVGALRRHLQAVLRPGVCLYDDGGWKLSASADNSWASKIYLCQFVAREILGQRQDQALAARSERAHADWQRIGAADDAASDQFRSGRVIGSRFYPRLVTATLWLDESRAGTTAAARGGR